MDKLIPVFFIIVVIFAWEIIIDVFDVPTYLIPSPAKILHAMGNNSKVLTHDLWITFGESFWGLLIGSMTGFLFAVIIVHSRFLEKVFYPILISTQAIPIVAIAPLLILWFGYGLAGKVVMAALICFFPTTVNTAAGLKSVSNESLDFMKTIHASTSQVFFKLRLPACVPYFFVGLKTSAALSVIGAIVAELAGAKNGLGFRIVVSSSRMETPLLFAAIILSSLLGIFFYYSIDIVGKKILSSKHLLSNNNLN